MARRNRRRLEVWAITTDREWMAVHRFIGGDVPSVVVRDPSGAASRSYGVTGLPDSYLIDPQGRIRAKFSGAQNWTVGWNIAEGGDRTMVPAQFPHSQQARAAPGERLRHVVLWDFSLRGANGSADKTYIMKSCVTARLGAS